MQQRELQLSHEAKKDLEEIWVYRFQFSKQSADRLLDRIYEKCIRLTHLPRMGRPREDLYPNLRSIVEGNHTIFYQIRKKQIVIIRILHNRADFKRHLQ